MKRHTRNRESAKKTINQSEMKILLKKKATKNQKKRKNTRKERIKEKKESNKPTQRFSKSL